MCVTYYLVYNLLWDSFHRTKVLSVYFFYAYIY
nr:MAG TPA: hypothetical protein [Caudoviricetes sp.]